MGELTTREADATFAELICADAEWLDREFAALVSASFGVTPPWPGSPPLVPSRRPPAHGPTRPRPAAVPSRGQVRARAPGLRRQRSPPRRCV